MIPKVETMLVKEKTPYMNEYMEPQASSYKRAKKWVYFLLERPSSRFAVFYHFTSLLLILGSLIVSVLSTIKELEKRLDKIMFYYEFFLLLWFSGEFAMRLWSCSYVSRYQGKMGRLRFVLSVYMMIDIFVILSTITTFMMQVNGSYFAILRVTRFMQVFRILRIDRQRGDFRTMGNVVKGHSKELITVYFVGFVIMFSATYIVFLCEKHTEIVESINSSFNGNSTSEVTINNMANGLYWAVITVTSVGYGDLSPVTWAGKIFCAVFALIGCAFFSLPAGILGSGFALQVAKQKKEKRFVKVRNPAAYLIQTMWRNYSLRKEKAELEATWYYLLPMLRETSDNSQALETLMRNEINNGSERLGCMFPPVFSQEGFKGDTNRQNDMFNNNPLEERIKKLGKIIARKNSDPMCISQSNLLRRENLVNPKYRYQKYHPRRDSKTTNRESKTSSSEYTNGGGKSGGASGREPIQNQLHERYKIALWFIMKLRFLTAIKIFKSVRHPFVNMQDIMEKNAMSHVEMLGHIKSMKDSFTILHKELLELRYTLIQLNRKQEQENRKSTDGNAHHSQNSAHRDTNDDEQNDPDAPTFQPQTAAAPKIKRSVSLPAVKEMV